MNCSQSNQYLSIASTTEGLKRLGGEALESVKASFQCPVDYGVTASELAAIRYRLFSANHPILFIKNPSSGGGRFIEGDKRFYVLNNEEWICNRQLGILPVYVGAYNYISATILLREDRDSTFSWCRNVLIHETLHSVSLYSRIWNNPPDIIQKHKGLSEGLTECLTGYIISRRYPDCYDTYKSNFEGKCGIAYRPITKLFCSLAQVVGIVPLANFYLSQERELESPWTHFINEIHQLGFPNFRFRINGRMAFRETMFRDECVKNIAGFRKIYDSAVKSLDFSQIR